MGKQVNFFMMLEDEKYFLENIMKDGKTKLARSHPEKPEIQIINSIDEVSGANQELFILLINLSLPIAENYIKEIPIKLENVKPGQEMKRVNIYIDKMNAPVIEFIRSDIKQETGALRRGRIWASMNRFENGQFYYKGTEFEKWYDGIARWLRRNLTKYEGYYFGKKALDWHLQGGKVTEC